MTPTWLFNSCLYWKNEPCVLPDPSETCHCGGNQMRMIGIDNIRRVIFSAPTLFIFSMSSLFFVHSLGYWSCPKVCCIQHWMFSNYKWRWWIDGYVSLNSSLKSEWFLFAGFFHFMSQMITSSLPLFLHDKRNYLWVYATGVISERDYISKVRLFIRHVTLCSVLFVVSFFLTTLYWPGFTFFW